MKRMRSKAFCSLRKCFLIILHIFPSTFHNILHYGNNLSNNYINSGSRIIDHNFLISERVGSTHYRLEFSIINYYISVSMKQRLNLDN